MSQLTYPIDAPVAFEGLLANATQAKLRSYFSEESSAEMLFGRMVQQGTADAGAKSLTAINNVLAGILAFAHAYEPGAVSGGVIPKDALSVLVEGDVWVICEEAFTPASAVHCRGLAGAGAVGRFRVTADSTNTFQLYGCKFLNSGGAGALARLSFNLAAHNAAAAALVTGATLFAPHA